MVFRNERQRLEPAHGAIEQKIETAQRLRRRLPKQSDGGQGKPRGGKGLFFGCLVAKSGCGDAAQRANGAKDVVLLQAFSDTMRLAIRSPCQARPMRRAVIFEM